MGGREQLLQHLESGATTTCRAWQVTRRDGLVLGFTDHDRDLSFEGVTFRADSGLTAGMLQHSSGMSVDNTEVIGALSNDAITEIDLRSGRFDGAEVTIWLLNWRNPEERVVRFRGTFGEIQIAQGEFRVDLRGLTEPLNQARGLVYQPACSAILGDSRCKVDLNNPAFLLETTIKGIGRAGQYILNEQPDFAEHWFEWGKVTVTTGAALGLQSSIRSDKTTAQGRSIELMTDFNIVPEIGDTLALFAGCDKTGPTCRAKFSNFLNFRGFPHIPGNDWMASTPASNQRNDGGSRFK